MCGERKPVRLRNRQGPGSSPRVRGTEPKGIKSGKSIRFIPACAGNGDLRNEVSDVRPVHPRVCGERIRGGGLHAAPCGSSPRVRGTGIGIWDELTRRRFIPACAGNGPPRRSPKPSAPVHPRVCGERVKIEEDQVERTGSSPRVRGTDTHRWTTAAATRFIPASAGNGNGCDPCDSCDPVHPRVCGERQSVNPHPDRVLGSSPRVRGTARQSKWQRILARFIPACAGNGRGPHGAFGGRPVHPRVCGERPELVFLRAS